MLHSSITPLHAWVGHCVCYTSTGTNTADIMLFQYSIGRLTVRACIRALCVCVCTGAHDHTGNAPTDPVEAKAAALKRYVCVCVCPRAMISTYIA